MKKVFPYFFYKRQGERGSILIVVLGVALILVMVALYLGQTVMLHYRATENIVASLQAEQAIEGAIRYITNYLATMADPGYLPSADELAVEAVPVGEATYWVIGRDPDAPEQGATTVTFGLIDEASKINLNTAEREVLEALPGMTSDLAAAIIDWRDEDEEPTEGGAESEDYAFGTEGYHCKNGPFDSVEELMLVKGCDWQTLYGEDWNRNGVLDPNENDGDQSWPPDDADGNLDAGLIEYLTVWSREPNRRQDGQERININTDRQGLQQLLSETLGEQRASEVMNRIGNTPEIRSVLEFYIRSGLEPEEFQQIEDAVTVSDQPMLQGLVNVCTAPQQVLAALPGMDEGTASQLIAYRSRLTEDQLRSITWVAEALDEETAIELGPWITVHSYQFGLDIVAVGRNLRGFRRVWVIVDMADGTPRIVYRKDWTGLGWPLEEEGLNEVFSTAGILGR